MKDSDEITLEVWAKEMRFHLEAFIAQVQEDQAGCDPDYPKSAAPGDWDEWFLMFQSGGD